MKISKRGIATVLLLTVMLSVFPSISVSAAALQISYSASSSYADSVYYSRLKSVELTGDQVADIVNIAESQVDYHESSSSYSLSGSASGSGNCTEYGRWYGMQDNWCNVFVSWCAYVAGVKTSAFPKLPSCTASYYSVLPSAGALCFPFSDGRALEPGDLVFCCTCSASRGCIDHVGLVVKVDSDYIYTVEGNVSDRVRAIKYPVYSGFSSAVYAQINYVARPAYEDNSSTLADVNKAAFVTVKGESVYALYDLALSAADAEAVCSSMGGHLVDIKDEAELKTVTAIAEKGKYSQYYIGLTDEKENGTYLWSDGSEENDSGLYAQSAFSRVTLTADGSYIETPEKKRATGFICEIDSLSPSNTAILESSRFEVYESALTYEQAKAFAESKGGKLAVIDTAARASLLPLLLKEGKGYFLGETGTEKELLSSEFASYGEAAVFSKGSENCSVLLSDGSRAVVGNYAPKTVNGFLVEYDEKESYTVVYDTNEGTGTPNEQLCDGEKEIALSAVEPVKTGFTFLGWALEKNAKAPSFSAGDSFKTNENTVLYAVWAKNSSVSE